MKKRGVLLGLIVILLLVSMVSGLSVDYNYGHDSDFANGSVGLDGPIDGDPGQTITWKFYNMDVGDTWSDSNDRYDGHRRSALMWDQYPTNDDILSGNCNWRIGCNDDDDTPVDYLSTTMPVNFCGSHRLCTRINEYGSKNNYCANYTRICCEETNSGIEICDGIDNDCNDIVDDGVCICGNNIIENFGDYSEECDDGDTRNIDNCTAFCKNNTCGDGYTNIIYGLEDCDDGNMNDGDGCSSSCVVEPGYICDLEANGTSICCFNECAYSGDIDGECVNMTTRRDKACGYLDGDNCLEWTSWNNVDCPEGEWCEFGVCGNPPPQVCDDYRTKGACEAIGNQTIIIGKRTVNELLNAMVSTIGVKYCNSVTTPINVSGNLTYYVRNCRCEWSVDSGKCGSTYDLLQIDNSTDVPIRTPNFGNCKYTTANIENNCNTTGKIMYTRTANWTGLGDGSFCQDSVVEYLCVRSTKLGFFSVICFLTALCLVIFIYTIFLRKI